MLGLQNFCVQVGVVAHAGNLSIQEAETGGSAVQGHFLQHSKSEASLGQIGSYIKKEKKKDLSYICCALTLWWFKQKCPIQTHLFEYLILREWHYLGQVVWPCWSTYGLMEETYYQGQFLRSQKHKPGPMALSPSCRSRSRTLSNHVGAHAPYHEDNGINF